MSELTWDGTGERFYETGVDHGVLYIPTDEGVYNNGVAWNGLTAITEKPSGAESNKQFADNIEYLNLFSAEAFGATLEAFTFPDEFAAFDGLGIPVPGLTVGQQTRKAFGLSYRSKKGNDLNDDLGYKLHLIYGCKASPSEKAYTTVNDSPAPITFSWEITTTPAQVTDFKPTAIITLDSTLVDADALAALESLLYGTDLADPELPTPDEVIALFAGSITTVSSITAPTYNSSTDLVTIPTVAGVQFYLNGDAVAAGTHAITESATVTAAPTAGYIFADGVDNDWHFTYA